ncbi:cupin domain-containing protein [Caulobacter segnis]|uniref:JmjC domain-containing protein n=1 Tax=Caulobacter segnis TaxID=88688 RepID=UPI00240EA030|nr:cupin domain-containing protein [Caulobacter segnis]MDG2520821.1 cupin domain-containing protein [Caulobacter segnis]
MLRFDIDREEFIAKYFEKQPFLQRKALSKEFSWATIDDVINRGDGATNFIKLVSPGRNEEFDFFEDYFDGVLKRRRLIKEKVYDYMSRGATLIIGRLDVVSTPVADLARVISQYLCARTTVNGYASFGGSAATKVHCDPHDVFAVQLLGKKRWEVFHPASPLPVKRARGGGAEEPGPLAMSVLLEAGDVLYIPRGWYHNVTPVEGCETIHAAVGLNVPTFLDYIDWLSRGFMAQHACMRQGLVPGAWSPQALNAAAEAVAAMIKDEGLLRRFIVDETRLPPAPSSVNLAAGVSKLPPPISDLALIYLNPPERALREGSNLSVEMLEVLGVLRDQALGWCAFLDIHSRLSERSRESLTASIWQLAHLDVITLRDASVT